MRLGLVSMPWAIHTRPSAALGALAAYAKRALPDCEVHCAHAYVRAAVAVGFELYEAIAIHGEVLGEMLYMAELYPEREDAIRAQFATWSLHCFKTNRPADVAPQCDHWGDVFNHVRRMVSNNIGHTATGLLGFDLVGLTTNYEQLFGSLALAQRLKEVSPSARVVLGGPLVSGPIGPSILAEYEFVDYVIQGEGERPLVALVEALCGDRPVPPIPGLLRRDETPPAKPMHWEVEALDSLPIPDFDEYVQLADEFSIDWMLSLESSRGCWWDRSRRTGNPRHSCLFCGANVQWEGYREKSPDRVAQEVARLAELHSNTRIDFMDNVLRHSDVDGLAQAIRRLGKDLDLFWEIRANIHPSELLALWEAGLARTQIGIESLSGTLLRRLGKGTSVIQNLQVMKTCFELGVRSISNLMIGVPGATAAQIDEQVHVINEYAVCYEPCNLSYFQLQAGAPAERLLHELGMSNVRVNDFARAGLPQTVAERLVLLQLGFDRVNSTDWGAVERACDDWRRRHREASEPLLRYYDGGTFVSIVDRRRDYLLLTLEELTREVYLYCLEIRSLASITSRFQAYASAEDLKGALDQMVQQRIMFQEGPRYLGLAIASTPTAAARRIRAASMPASDRS